MAKVTIKDVAALAGVSVGTVSMTLNNSPKITDKKKEAVMDAVKKLNYRRDPYARSFSLSSSRSIGLILPGLTNPFFGEVANYAQQALVKKDYGLLLGLSKNDSQTESRVINKFLDLGVDGLIIVPVDDKNADISHLYSLFEEKIPVVFLTSYYQEFPKNCVMANLKDGMFKATEYLIKTGHKNILMVSGDKNIVSFSERIKGFKKAFEKANMPLRDDQIIFSKDVGYSGGYNALKDRVNETNSDAIIAINDVMAMGIISQLRANGIRVPEDISVIGYDDISIAELQETPLTTVKQPIEDMCEEGVELLFSLINGNSCKENIKELPVALKLRKSVKLRTSIDMQKENI